MQSQHRDVPTSAAASSSAGDSALRELEKLRERERQMIELLGSHSPERLLHDLRNVLNEVQLLRAVVGDDEKD
jgi:hypothetical protein